MTKVRVKKAIRKEPFDLERLTSALIELVRHLREEGSEVTRPTTRSRGEGRAR